MEFKDNFLEGADFKVLAEKLQETKHPEAFTISRNLAKEGHRAPKDVEKDRAKGKAVQLELFAGLSSEEQRVAVGLSGGTANIITDIIETLPSTRKAGKVIIALAQTFHEQSDSFKKEGKDYSKRIETKSGKEKIVDFGSMRGVSETIKRYFPKLTGVKSPFGGTYPYILLDIAEFTKLVNGTRGEACSASGADKMEVKDTLQQLAEKEVWSTMGNLRGATKLLSIEYKLKSEEGQKKEYWLLALRPIFYEAIEKDYIQLRADTLKRLKGKQKDITMKLFWMLQEHRSYGIKFEKSKRELLAEIATIERYKKNKSILKADFEEAINKMKELELITEYTERDGANGELISVFKFNTSYIREAQTEEEES